MKVYISGPVTGTKNYEEKFECAELILENEGHMAVNPVRVNAELPENTEYEEYMSMAITMLKMCDAICFLDGWEKSLGANREYGYALASGKEIFEIKNGIFGVFKDKN